MKRDAMLVYGGEVPLPTVLGHERFRSYCRLGVALRRAAARALNEAMVKAGLTRRELASASEMHYEALSRVCNAKQSMDLGLLKRALQRLGCDWRATLVRFTEPLDYRPPAREPGDG
jgi:hypothetical protein